MRRCQVLIVGGGPAGSTCAAELVRAGLDVVVADKARFPRDKVCAGWITPPVVEELALDLHEYRRGRTLQPVTGFRLGRMGDREHLLRYPVPVSYGIRRCEFDSYLLERSGAALELDCHVDTVERRGDVWTVGDRFQADVLVGAGGHFCPVARALGGRDETAPIAAAEVELSADARDMAGCAAAEGVGELYFTRDLAGYGWVFRKGAFVNIGLGVRAGGDGRGPAAGPSLRERTDDFLQLLVERGRLARRPAARMRGHAYFAYPDSRRRRFGDGFVLVGDAAGLAYAQSGEGIRCAVESGLLAGQVIARACARGRARAADLAGYGRAIEQRYGADGRTDRDPSLALPAALRRGAAAMLMASGWFSRRVVLERWFLRTADSALALS